MFKIHIEVVGDIDQWQNNDNTSMHEILPLIPSTAKLKRRKG